LAELSSDGSRPSTSPSTHGTSGYFALGRSLARCSFLGSRTGSSPRSVTTPGGRRLTPVRFCLHCHSPSTTESHLHPRAVRGRPRPGLFRELCFFCERLNRLATLRRPAPARPTLSFCPRLRGVVRFRTPSTHVGRPGAACGTEIPPALRQTVHRGRARILSNAAASTNESCDAGRANPPATRTAASAALREEFGDRGTCPGCFATECSSSGEERPQEPPLARSARAAGPFSPRWPSFSA
jgi:hypothetical protein